MFTSSKAKILGVGAYLPKRVLTNADLEKMVDTSDEWITTRTGIKERRIADKDEFSSCMGLKAAEQAIQSADISIDSIDMILVATLTPDYIFPSTACLLQKALGAKSAAALDIQAACSGYLYALALAKSLVESSSYRNILIVATEKLSTIVDYQDRATCVLFGDGATAAVVGKGEKGLTIETVRLGADGELSELLILPAGGSRNPASLETIEKKMHFLSMDGKEVFKHAVRRMESVSKECMEAIEVQESEIGWLIPHQANERIIDAMAKRFSHLPRERIYKTLHKYGNTSASSVGIALTELLQEGHVNEGEYILLTAFGAGLTWGGAILKKE